MSKTEEQPPYRENPPPYAPAPPGINLPPSTQPTPVVTTVTITQPENTGSCPVCHKGNFTTGCCSYTLAGWLCGIFCFPCGVLICCCCMRKKRCNHCGFSPS